MDHTVDLRLWSYGSPTGGGYERGIPVWRGRHALHSRHYGTFRNFIMGCFSGTTPNVSNGWSLYPRMPREDVTRGLSSPRVISLFPSVFLFFSLSYSCGENARHTCLLLYTSPPPFPHVLYGEPGFSNSLCFSTAALPTETNVKSVTSQCKSKPSVTVDTCLPRAPTRLLEKLNSPPCVQKIFPSLHMLYSEPSFSGTCLPLAPTRLLERRQHFCGAHPPPRLPTEPIERRMHAASGGNGWSELTLSPRKCLNSRFIQVNSRTTPTTHSLCEG